jgi:hypothetical protein
MRAGELMESMRSIANIIQSHMKGSQDSSLKTEKETLAT